MTYQCIINEIRNKADKDLAILQSRFFKTGKGEYAEGDLFYGLSVPEVRKIASKYTSMTDLNDIQQLISNSYHEVRLSALVILISQFKKASDVKKEKIYNFYLSNIKYINNWDLVDLSAKIIVGGYLFDKDISPIWVLAKSQNLWRQRVSVLASFYFINKNEFGLSLQLAEYFLNHKHDLIHKATGWMLREVGKKDIDSLYSFLDKYHKSMPRTMLRYSIERIPDIKRKFYMQK